MSELDQFLKRAHAILDRLEGLLPEALPVASTDSASSFRWRRRGSRGMLEEIRHSSPVVLADLQCIDRQKEVIDRNTRQFLRGLPANNVLLAGPRGTGKSSLVKALLNAYRADGLKLIEIGRDDVADLRDAGEAVGDKAGRFIVYCDDLSFEAGDAAYKSFKSAIDGSTGMMPENVVIYATSNRRHLIPETMRENLDSRIVEGELHLSEALEEKLSLSERFGIWLTFQPFDQDQYLAIVEYWLRRLGAPAAQPEVTRAALQWALERGSRSGRSAWQFACDRTGRQRLRDA